MENRRVPARIVRPAEAWVKPCPGRTIGRTSPWKVARWRCRRVTTAAQRHRSQSACAFRDAQFLSSRCRNAIQGTVWGEPVRTSLTVIGTVVDEWSTSYNEQQVKRTVGARGGTNRVRVRGGGGWKQGYNHMCNSRRTLFVLGVNPTSA